MVDPVTPMSQPRPVASTGHKDAVIRLPNGSGLCSVLVNVTLGLMYAEANDMRVFLNEDETPLRDPSWPSFWRRYFRPVGCRGTPPQENGPAALFYKPEINAWARSSPLTIPSLDLSGDPLAVKQQFVRRFVQPKHRVRRLINERKGKLNLPDFYVAANIRRGDKITIEPTQTVTPLAKYVETINRIFEDRPQDEARVVYVASDDYQAIEELRAMDHGWTIVSLTPEDNRGFFLNDMTRWTSKQRHSHFVGFLTEMNIMSEAPIFVGVLCTNVGFWVAYNRYGKSNDTFISLDYPFPKSLP